MSARDLFVEDARGTTIAEAMGALPLGKLSNGSAYGEHVGPCPACGGTDRFQVNPKNSAWLCRGSTGGRDAISLAAHVLGLDVRRQEDFLLACAAVLGTAVPGDEIETPAEARLREERLTARRQANEAAAAQAANAAHDFREAERKRARGKWELATREGDHVIYLAKRLDCWKSEVPVAPFLRTIKAEAYWHGKDERGSAVEIFEGPAMVAPFVDPNGLVIGCHLTWFDLKASLTKFRPRVPDPEDPRGRGLPTKKMRGSKKGGMIPLVGFYHSEGLILPDLFRPRLVAGEGIENVLAIALAEGPRADTLYCAAGDLGNLAGPPDPTSRFTHPEIRKADRNGVMRPVFVQGPVPKADQTDEDAMQAPRHVTEILLVGDGDSEVFATASAMARSSARLGAHGAMTTIVWPPRGLDFTDLLSATPES